ncbi:MAG: hypothetical protein WC841_03535 [Candidatus Shapirobacteria bacterium]|jgi:hypothetical protein
MPGSAEQYLLRAGVIGNRNSGGGQPAETNGGQQQPANGDVTISVSRGVGNIADLTGAANILKILRDLEGDPDHPEITSGVVADAAQRVALELAHPEIAALTKSVLGPKNGSIPIPQNLLCMPQVKETVEAIQNAPRPQTAAVAPQKRGSLIGSVLDIFNPLPRRKNDPGWH